MQQPTSSVSQHPAQVQLTSYWDVRSETYDGTDDGGLGSSPHHAAWTAELREILPTAPAEVVDVGTGTGFLAILLAELGHTVRGFDLSEGMMARTQAKVATLANPPTFAVGDAHDPPVPPASADLVTCRYLMWTLPDPPRALAAWKRILRPDGRLLIIDGLWWAGAEPPSADNVEEHLARFPKTYDAAMQAQLPLMLTESVIPMIQVIESAGFEILKLIRLVRVEDVDRQLTPERYGKQPRYAIVARPGPGA